MQKLNAIKANELKEGQWFKTKTTQRKFRFAAFVGKFREGDTEYLRGKILIMLPGCAQLTIPENEEIFIP